MSSLSDVSRTRQRGLPVNVCRCHVSRTAIASRRPSYHGTNRRSSRRLVLLARIELPISELANGRWTRRLARPVRQASIHRPQQRYGTNVCHPASVVIGRGRCYVEFLVQSVRDVDNDDCHNTPAGQLSVYPTVPRSRQWQHHRWVAGQDSCHAHSRQRWLVIWQMLFTRLPWRTVGRLF